MLNASHVRTNRAAFSDASMSSSPRAPGLVAHDAHDMTVDAGEAAHDVHGPVREHLEEVAVVDDSAMTSFMS